MSRLVSSIALLAAMAATAPVLAADWGADEWGYGGDLRGGLFNEPKDWSGLGDETDPLRFDAGIRYWYSMGAQSFGIDGGTVETSDVTHSGEAYLRIDDVSSRAYIKGSAGYSFAIDGDYATPSGAGSIGGGSVGYGLADFGWYAFGDGKSGVGLLAGYQYWNDSPRTERDNYAIISTLDGNEDTGDWTIGGDGVERNVDIHALRLGFTGRAEFGDMFDITGELAAIPYASISGNMGGGAAAGGIFGGAGCDVVPPGGCPAVGPILTSPLGIEGWGYGGAAEITAGFRPVENVKFSLGARAWYLQGTYDATYSAAYVTRPQRQPDEMEGDPPVSVPPDPLYSAPSAVVDDYIVTNNPFSMMRYGLFAGVSYTF